MKTLERLLGHSNAERWNDEIIINLAIKNMKNLIIVSIIFGLIASNVLILQRYTDIQEENKKLIEKYSEIEAKNKKLIEDYSILKASNLKNLDILNSVINSIYLRLGNHLVQKSITKTIPILDIAQTVLEIKDDCKAFDELNELRSKFNVEIRDKPAICDIVNSLNIPLPDDNSADEAAQAEFMRRKRLERQQREASVNKLIQGD